MAPNHFIKISEVGVLAWGSRIWIGMSGAGLHESDFSNASWVGIVWSWIPIFGLWDLISDFRFRTSQRFGFQDVELIVWIGFPDLGHRIWTPELGWWIHGV